MNCRAALEGKTSSAEFLLLIDAAPRARARGIALVHLLLSSNPTIEELQAIRLHAP